MTQKVKMLTDPSIPRLSNVAADALVTITDKTSGATSTVEFKNLYAQIKEAVKMDLLNGKTVGVTAGSIPYIMQLSGPNSLRSDGYLVDGSTGIPVFTDYLKAALKKLIDQYPSGGVFFAVASPGSTYWIQAYIYPGKHSSGLPLHSLGIAYTLSNTILRFQISNGVFSSTTLGAYP